MPITRSGWQISSNDSGEIVKGHTTEQHPDDSELSSNPEDDAAQNDTGNVMMATTYYLIPLDHQIHPRLHPRLFPPRPRSHLCTWIARGSDTAYLRHLVVSRLEIWVSSILSSRDLFNVEDDSTRGIRYSSSLQVLATLELSYLKSILVIVHIRNLHLYLLRYTASYLSIPISF
jgi:hypothetical protein